MSEVQIESKSVHEQAEAYSRGEVAPLPAEASPSSSGGGRRVLVDMAAGALAGAVGVWAMDKVGWFLYEQEHAAALEREREARVHGKDPAHAALDKVSELSGVDVASGQPSAAGIGVHYGLGVVPGALYGAARREWPQLRAGGGALYGLGLFVTQDEMMAPLLGIAGSPGEYPWEAHARGLISHATLGVVTETVLSLFDRAR